MRFERIFKSIDHAAYQVASYGPQSPSVLNTALSNVRQLREWVGFGKESQDLDADSFFISISATAKSHGSCDSSLSGLLCP